MRVVVVVVDPRDLLRFQSEMELEEVVDDVAVVVAVVAVVGDDDEDDEEMVEAAAATDQLFHCSRNK